MSYERWRHERHDSLPGHRRTARRRLLSAPGAGFGVAFKLDGSHTGGTFSVVEHPFDVGVMVPPHRDTREDEFSIVTAGEIGFRSGGREVVLEQAATSPRGGANYTPCGTLAHNRRG